MLFKKLLRTFKSYMAQFISMIIMVTLGIGIFAGFHGEWCTIASNTEAFYEETGFADYRIVNKAGFSEDDLQTVLSIDGITEASRYVAFAAKESREDDTINLTITENEKVSGVCLIEGAAYDKESTDGIWINRNYMDRNDYEIGDSITLTYGSIFTGTFVIKGIIMSSEYTINTPEGGLMPSYATCGYAYISPAALKKIITEKFGESYYNQGIYAEINMISDLDTGDISEKLDKAFGKTMQLVTKDDIVSYAEVQGEKEEGQTMANILPFIFLLIAILTMVTTMNRLVANEKVQIGILKALGFKDRKIIFHYTSYALFIGIIGSVLGAALGYGVAYFIMNPNGSMGTYFEMPTWDITLPWFVWLGILAIILFLVLIGFLSVKNALKGTAADALRPYEPDQMKQLLIEKGKLFHKMSFATRWNMRDTFRHPARTFMTVFGVFGCSILIFASFGMYSTFRGYLDSFYNKSMVYASKISLKSEADDETIDKLIQDYDADYSSTGAIKMDGETYVMSIYSFEKGLYNILDTDGKAIKDVSDDGVYICRRMHDDLGLKKGDKLTFSLYGSSETYTVPVAGVILSASEGITMSATYAEEIGLTVKADTLYTDTEYSAIKENDAITSVQKKSEIVDSFDSMMIVFYEMIILLVGFSVVLGFVVLYNLGVMSLTERRRELSTLKVLGFKDKKIGRLLISENIWLTVIGIAIGIPVGMGVLDYLMKALASEYEMNVVYQPYCYIFTIIITLGISWFVGLRVSGKTKKIDMVEALKAQD